MNLDIDNTTSCFDVAIEPGLCGLRDLEQTEFLSDSVTTTSDSGSSTLSIDEDVVEAKEDKIMLSSTVSVKPCNNLLIFDYDDTLFPTSYLAQKGYRLDGPDASPELQRILDEYCLVVKKTLLTAREYGNVVVVTNAETGWIELTSQKFIPTLSSLLETFPLVSARSIYEPLGISSPFQWKVRAFESVIFEHFSVAASDNARHVISFGDSIHERDAAHQVCAKSSITTCKSIKFIERPDLSQLTKQHGLIVDCFEQIVSHDGTLDLCIQCHPPGRDETP